MSLISNQSGAPTGGGDTSGIFLRDEECFVKLFEGRPNLCFDVRLKDKLFDFARAYSKKEVDGFRVVEFNVNPYMDHVIGKIMAYLTKFVYNDNKLRAISDNFKLNNGQDLYNAYSNYIKQLCTKKPIIIVLSNFYEESNKITEEDIYWLLMIMDKCPNVRIWICSDCHVEDDMHSLYQRFYDMLDPIPYKLYNDLKNGNILPYVYVSYNWEPKSDEAVKRICLLVKRNGMAHRRDKENCGYRKDIHSFMDLIRDGRYVVVLFSKSYLESFYCMYELAGILSHKDYQERLFPVLVDDSLRDDSYYYELIKLWKEKKQDKLFKKQLQYKPLRRFTLKSKDALIDDYLKKIPVIKDYVTKINTGTLIRFQESNFQPLIDDLLNATR